MTHYVSTERSSASVVAATSLSHSPSPQENVTTKETLSSLRASWQGMTLLDSAVYRNQDGIVVEGGTFEAVLSPIMSMMAITVETPPWESDLARLRRRAIAKNPEFELELQRQKKMLADKLMLDGRTYGRVLMGLRLSANLTQEQLAEKAGLKQPFINRIEKGGSGGLPSPKTLLSMCRAFDIMYSDLIKKVEAYAGY